MSKTLVLALAAACSLFASAAIAGDSTTKDASKPATASKASKPAKQAQTPTAAGVSTTTSAGSNMASDVVAMAPVPDTKENRAKYGKPLSRMGRETATRGN